MVLIVTGSTGGIGRCIVNRAVKSPGVEKVYCMYRKEKKLKNCIYADHPKIFPVRHDASHPEENSCLMGALNETQPDGITCIHTAFRISPVKRVGTYLPEEIRENIFVNVMDMVFLVNGLIQLKQTVNSPLRVINIDSGAAYKPLEGWGMYSAAKAYADMFLKSVQMENPDVKVVSYEPGVVDTPMQDEIRKTDREVFGQVDMFKEYYEKNMLRSPDAVAGDIVTRFVESWEGNNFREGFGRQ